MKSSNLLACLGLLLCVGFTMVFLVQVLAAEDPSSSADIGNTINNMRSMRTGSARYLQRDPFVLEPGGATEALEAPARETKLETAILLLQDKEYAEVIPLLEAELERIPTVEAVWEGLGWAYYGVGRVDDAESLWQKYVALRPDSPKAHSLLAQLAILRSDWRDADKHLSRGVELDPGNFDIRYWYSQNLFRLGRLETAVQIMEALVKEDDMRYDVKTDLARVYVLLQDYEAGLDLWEEIVDVFPDNLDFRTEYARALMLTGGLEEADEQARRILAEDPDRLPVMMLRADVAELSKLPEEMIPALKALIGQAEDDEIRAQLKVRLAVRYIILNREDAKQWPLEPALDLYAAATDAVPDYVPWLNQYAALALRAGRPRVARRITDHVLKEINPYNQQALRSRFELAMVKRDYDAAERALDEVYARLDPGNPYRFFDRARIEVARGRFLNAMDELDKFEEAGHKGAVLTLLYHGLTESEWMAMTSTRRLREHLTALLDAGYTFIPVSDIPEYLRGERARPSDRPGKMPWLARQVDNVRYAFTGRRQHVRLSDLPPEKVAVVTFDDGDRSSFLLGTPVAEDLQIPFWMAIITHIEELNALIYAAWEEIRAYHETGVWEMGSHTMWANTDMPSGPEPSPLIAPLPNRVWLPERNRLETMREWSRRVRHEFEGSRELIEQRLDLEPGEFMAVAYPYGDVGQSEGSNVARLINPVRTILNEASRMHSLGFIVEERGYTTPDDNMLLMRRYEPAWDAEAEDVLEHALMTHPVFMARHLRAEIAALSDRPYLAKRQLELLRRDGYPERQLRELRTFVESRSPAGRVSMATEDDSADGRRRALLRPSNLYVAGDYRVNQANEEIRLRNGDFRAGLNINPVLNIDFLYREGSIKQRYTTNIWFTIPRTERFTSTETRQETVDGVTTVVSVRSDSSTTRDVQTNRVERYFFEAEVEEIRGAVNLRLDDATTLSLSAGQKMVIYEEGFEREAGRERKTVGTVAISWSPYTALRLGASYNRDLVPSARKTIPYDAAGLGILWRIADEWEFTGGASYASYRDKNSLLGVNGASFWELIQRQGIWLGAEAEVYSMSDDSPYYWSPYWDTRYAGVLRLRKNYPFYNFKADLRIGQQQEKGRPEDIIRYRNLRAQAAADGTWDPGPRPGSGWSSFVGVAGEYRQRIWRRFDLIINGSTNFLRDYSEHDVSLGLQLNF